MYIPSSFSIVVVVSAIAALFSNVEVAEAGRSVKWNGAPAAAKRLFHAAVEIPSGSYRLRNGNGQYATFFSQGNDFRILPMGKGNSDPESRSTVFTIRQHRLKYNGYRAVHSIHIFNRSGREKCLTSSWGSYANTFGVFDMCRIDLLGKPVKGSKKHITSAHGKLADDKQMFIFVPAGRRNTYRITAVARITDMLTRCLYGTHIAGNGAMGYYKGLFLNDCTKKTSPLFQWTLERVKRSRSLINDGISSLNDNNSTDTTTTTT